MTFDLSEAPFAPNLRLHTVVMWPVSVADGKTTR